MRSGWAQEGQARRDARAAGECLLLGADLPLFPLFPSPHRAVGAAQPRAASPRGPFASAASFLTLVSHLPGSCSEEPPPRGAPLVPILVWGRTPRGGTAVRRSRMRPTAT